MKKFIAALLISLILIFPVNAAVLGSRDVPTDPCITKEQVLNDIIQAVPDVVAVESGNTMTFMSPSRNEDLQLHFNKDGCVDKTTLLSKPPVT